MREIKGLAKVEGELGQLSLSQFRRVLECCYREETCDDVTDSRLDLVVESEFLTPPRRLRIILRGVRSLTLKNFGIRVQITGLRLADISEWQWERISWKLDDYEEGRIQCHAAEAEIVLET